MFLLQLPSTCYLLCTIHIWGIEGCLGNFPEAFSPICYRTGKPVVRSRNWNIWLVKSRNLNRKPSLPRNMIGLGYLYNDIHMTHCLNFVSRYERSLHAGAVDARRAQPRESRQRGRCVHCFVWRGNKPEVKVVDAFVCCVSWSIRVIFRLYCVIYANEICVYTYMPNFTHKLHTYCILQRRNSFVTIRPASRCAWSKTWWHLSIWLQKRWDRRYGN